MMNYCWEYREIALVVVVDCWIFDLDVALALVLDFAI